MTRRSVTDGQYGSLARRLGEVARRVDEGTIPFDSTMSALQRIIDGEERARKTIHDLLGPAADLCTAPAYARFVTREHFGNKKAKVKTYLYGNFEKHLLNLIEEGVPEESLKVRPLNRASRDTPILTELGEKQETKLAHVWYALESGSLRKDAYYLFYVRDADNVLWAVRVNWYGDAWSVYARSVVSPYVWSTGDLVVSR